jgi:hypothetical protein
VNPRVDVVVGSELTIGVAIDKRGRNQCRQQQQVLFVEFFVGAFNPASSVPVSRRAEILEDILHAEFDKIVR